jgi:hypothetical protein
LAEGVNSAASQKWKRHWPQRHRAQKE